MGEPQPGSVVAFVRARLAEAADARVGSALISDDEHILEASVGREGRWVVRSWGTEWIGGPDGLTCWHIIPAGGARRVSHRHPDDWVHPAVGLLRPELLPVWGRPGDSFRPVRVIEGAAGPAQLILEATTGVRVGGQPLDPGGTLHIDPRRWLVTRVERPEGTWTVTEYRDAGAPTVR